MTRELVLLSTSCCTTVFGKHTKECLSQPLSWTDGKKMSKSRGVVDQDHFNMEGLTR